MNDREFIELLNLYVDREISAGDALRLEAEVGADQERRRIYDQYCRMQKACSMLSAELTGAAKADRRVVAFPAPRTWRFGPMAGALAAAACIMVVLGLRHRAALDDSSAVAAAPGAPRTVPDTMELSLAPDPMRSVFSTRAAAGQSGRSSPRPLFALNEEAPPLAQLNWIGDIHMAPVFSGAKPDFLLTPKPDPKSGISEENPGRFPQEPGDMAAFRFQR